MPKKAVKPRRRKRHYYAWLLANTVAACVAVLSWLLTLHVVNHPEIPKYYALISKLGLAKEPVGFTLQQAPPGDAADPTKLYRRYAALDAPTTHRLNRALIRNYITGLGEGELIQYIEGSLKVLHVRKLRDDDLFTEGFAVRARAMIRPDEFSEPAPYPVLIDYLFPTPDTGARNWFKEGDLLEVKKIPNCAMVLHVDRDQDGDTPTVILTVVPIVMGEYQVGENLRFHLRKPEALNPSAPFPIFDPEPVVEP